jgi:hypothetical protein
MSFQDVGDIGLAGSDAGYLECFDVEQRRRRSIGMEWLQPAIDDNLGNCDNLGLDVLDLELGAAKRKICRGAEQRKRGLFAQPRQLDVQAPGIEQDCNRAVLVLASRVSASSFANIG